MLAAYAPEIDRLKARGGYVTADVIDVRPETPNLDAMLAKFSREHWHDEDEVRFILEGRGVFHVHPRTGDVLRDRGGPGRPDPRAARHVALVRPLRRAPDPRDPPVPGPGGLDAALHRERRRAGYEPVCLGPAHLRARRRERLQPRCVLLDVEGTTTPVDFVYDVLFPYARERVAAFLEAARRAIAEVARDLAGLRDEHARDAAAGTRPPAWDGSDAASAAAYARWLMDQDRKATALKSLQGRIWEEGYAAGELRGPGVRRRAAGARALARAGPPRRDLLVGQRSRPEAALRATATTAT